MYFENKWSDSKIEFSQRMICFYKKRSSVRKKIINESRFDELRNWRLVLRDERRMELLQYFVTDDGTGESYNKIYLLECKSEDDVWRFIKDQNLQTEYLEPPVSAHDCTGALYGGEPVIKKLCKDRYTLKYRFHFDV
ncbi:MAG: hypothetical protein IBX70_12150 [Clostridia bacterium]|nr:hypothetical protein [Clostridia bacterium]